MVCKICMSYIYDKNPSIEVSYYSLQVYLVYNIYYQKQRNRTASFIIQQNMVVVVNLSDSYMYIHM